MSQLFLAYVCFGSHMAHRSENRHFEPKIHNRGTGISTAPVHNGGTIRHKRLSLF